MRLEPLRVTPSERSRRDTVREHRHADRDEGHNEDDLVVRQSTLLHEQEREDDGREPAWPEPAEE